MTNALDTEGRLLEDRERNGQQTAAGLEDWRMQTASGVSTTGGRAAGAVLSPHDRIVQLEYENARLQHLVSELLAKNQQLRARL